MPNLERARAMQTLDHQIGIASWLKSEWGMNYMEEMLEDFLGYSRVSGISLPGETFDKDVPAGWRMAKHLYWNMTSCGTYYTTGPMCELISQAAKHMPDEPLLQTDFITPAGFIWLDRAQHVKSMKNRDLPIRIITWSPSRFAPVEEQSPEGVAAGEKVAKHGVMLTFWTDASDTDDTLSRNWKSGQAPRFLPITFYPIAYGQIAEERQQQDVVAVLRRQIESLEAEANALHEEIQTATTIERLESLKRELEALRSSPLLGMETEEEIYKYTEEHSILHLVKFTRAYWSISQQRVAARLHIPKKNLPRPFRRRMERAEIPEEEDIQIVTLRKSLEHNKSTGEYTVDWDHRWVVHGFWRNQFYPSIRGNRLIYVDDYIKGPEDKPLIVRDRVFAVKQ